MNISIITFDTIRFPDGSILHSGSDHLRLLGSLVIADQSRKHPTSEYVRRIQDELSIRLGSIPSLSGMGLTYG